MTDLPLPDFDQLALGDVLHRIRALDASQLQELLVHEAGHAARVPVLEILEARMRELDAGAEPSGCLLYTSPSPRDVEESRMPSSA